MSRKIAFIGAGRMANCHASWLKKMSDAEVAGVFDTNPEKSKKFSEIYGAKIYGSLEELLAEKSFDGICICNYAYDHVATMITVMKSGFRTIFCEKPVMRYPEEAQILRDAIAEYSPRIMIGHHRKHLNSMKKVKEILDSGRLGKVHYFKVHYCNPWYARDWKDYFASYDLSGGTTLDMATHYLDLLCWFFGDAVSASARAVMLEKSLTCEVEPFDYVNGIISFRNGIFGGLESSYQRYGECVDKIEIYGENYTLLSDFYTKVELKNKAETISVNFDQNDPYDLQMQEFIAMIDDRVERHTTVEEAIAASSAALAMMKSSELGGESVKF